jgi:hypothetical protein
VAYGEEEEEHHMMGCMREVLHSLEEARYIHLEGDHCIHPEIVGEEAGHCILEEDLELAGSACTGRPGNLHPSIEEVDQEEVRIQQEGDLAAEDKRLWAELQEEVRNLVHLAEPMAVVRTMACSLGVLQFREMGRKEDRRSLGCYST